MNTGKLFIAALTAIVTAATAASAATFYGTYQSTATHNCADASCTTATDVITATGSNTVQGLSSFTATFSDTSYKGEGELSPGQIVITSASDGSQIFGVLDLAFVPGIAPPALAMTGSVYFTGGTGAFSGFSGSQDLFTKGFFTGPTSAAGTVTFAPEPETWATLALSILGLAAWSGYRRRVQKSRTDREGELA